MGYAIGAVIGAALGFLVGRYLYQRFRTAEEAGARSQAEQILAQGRAEAERVVKEATVQARDEILTRREEFERETERTRGEIREIEKRIIRNEEALSRREDELGRRDKQLSDQEKRMADRQASLKQRSEQLEAKEQEVDERLLEVAGLSREDAETRVMARLEEELAVERDKLIRRRVEEAKDEAESEARMVVLTAIQRLGTTHMSEATVSTVDVPNDEMKGRIIGREGRNIRAFEQLTGIDVIIDDTPEAVVLSCFDPVRREIGRIALERLISDGRIHPTRIEEIVDKARREVDQTIRESADKACLDLGITGVNAEVMYTLGRLRYRTSYGQNILHHSVDVGYLCGMMASELGLDPAIARRSGLFHDIGKAVDHEVEGPHAEIGENLLRRHGESKVVCEAVGAHHDDAETMPSLYPVLVQAADAISGARPGARRETLATYIKRLERLEGIAREFGGVQNAFAIQAGREIRVMVDSNRVGDAEASHLSIEVARRIEKELDYPGTIKVVVIRESRSVEYAK